jgi:glycosyltransferase involved in cell wall biosynthesis
MPMRVLFWSETFWPRVGGVENLAARLLPALRARGHEFVVVTWENIEIPDQITYRDIPVFRFPFFSAGCQGSLAALLEYRRRVAQLKKEFAPDLVHVNSYGRSVLFHLETAGVSPTPSLVTLHQALPDEPIGRNSLLGNLLHSAAWVTACSSSVLAHVRKLLPEITPFSSVIHNGIEMPAQDPSPISFDPPRILCLGRLVPEKGFDLALAALSVVFRRFPNARLVIVGDGPQEAKLKQQTIDLGLARCVEFVGGVPPEKIADLIAEATLVLVPSRLEGFGLVALEAGSMARPVIAARVGGLPEVVAHDETGLLVESENSEALTEAIKLLIDQPDKARRMGLAARERAQKEFGWERHVDAYDGLYYKLIVGARESGSMNSRGNNQAAG